MTRELIRRVEALEELAGAITRDASGSNNGPVVGLIWPQAYQSIDIPIPSVEACPAHITWPEELAEEAKRSGWGNGWH